MDKPSPAPPPPVGPQPVPSLLSASLILMPVFITTLTVAAVMHARSEANRGDSHKHTHSLAGKWLPVRPLPCKYSTPEWDVSC